MGDYTKMAFPFSEYMKNLILSTILSLGGDRPTDVYRNCSELQLRDTPHTAYDVRGLKRSGVLVIMRDFCCAGTRFVLIVQ